MTRPNAADGRWMRAPARESVKIIVLFHAGATIVSAISHFAPLPFSFPAIGFNAYFSV